MSSPATYNRNAVGKHWHIIDIPSEWQGYPILLKGDLDSNQILDERELDSIDWIAFSEAVEDFQKMTGIALTDGKLGPKTLKHLQDQYALPSQDVLMKVGDDLVFKPSETPVSEPPGSEITGRNAEEKRICRLWNRYGKAIGRQALANGLSTDSALAVFSVESGSAYDPATGLLIIRYEPHIFTRRSGRDVPWKRGGQRQEWRSFSRAYDVDKEAALSSCSYGLPQLMGFNWRVTEHTSPKAMVLAFQRSCEEQIAGFFGFVEANNLLRYIKAANWRAFTRAYNGPGNVDIYSGRLIRALKVIDSLKADGASFGLKD
jgi:hypothetical protein